MGTFDPLRKADEPIAWFAGDDAEMLGAIRQAQSTFSEFVSALAEESMRIVPAFDEALVKYAFPATKNGIEVEHMFLANVEMKNGAMWGVLASTPVDTDDVNEGDRIEIDPARISDWLYVINGAGTGGFTFKVMWTRFTEQEKSMYRDEPPFVWIDVP